MLRNIFTSGGKSSIEESGDDGDLAFHRRKKSPRSDHSPQTDCSPRVAEAFVQATIEPLPEPSIPIINHCDTYFERLDRWENMKPDQIESEEGQFINTLEERVYEKCKLCGAIAVARLNGCNETFCNNCLGMFFSTGLCSVCEVSFSSVTNLKTGVVVEVQLQPSE